MNLDALIALAKQKNPQAATILDSPRGKALLGVIQSGDSKKGEEIAMNLCQTYGVSKEDAIAQAKEFFFGS